MLAYTFGGADLGTTITWRLQPEGAGTRLLLEHTGFDLETELGRTAYQGMRAGWPAVLARVDAALAPGV